VEISEEIILGLGRMELVRLPASTASPSMRSTRSRPGALHRTGHRHGRPRAAGPGHDRWIRQAVEGPVRCHDLRHTCLTLLLEQHTPPPVVQQIAGQAALYATMTGPPARRSAVA
jgi:integrase